MSGVASFSPNRSLRCSQPTGVASPCSAIWRCAQTRDRVQRVLVELAADEHRRPLVEQADEGADQAGLALAALAEQDEVVAGDERPLDLGQHGVLEPDHAGQAGLAAAEPGQQVGAELGLDRAEGGAAVAELAEGRGGGGRGALRRDVRHLDHGTTAVGDLSGGRRSVAIVLRRAASALRLRGSRRDRSGEVPLVSGADVEAAAALLDGRRPAHAAVALAGPGRPRRRPGLAQVREPAAHRLVQDPRRLHAHLPAHRRRAGPRRRRRQRRQPRAGRRAGRPAARAARRPCSCRRPRRCRRWRPPGPTARRSSSSGRP